MRVWGSLWDEGGEEANGIGVRWGVEGTRGKGGGRSTSFGIFIFPAADEEISLLHSSRDMVISAARIARTLRFKAD